MAMEIWQFWFSLTPDQAGYDNQPKAIHIGDKVYIRKAAQIEVVGEWDSLTPKNIIGDNTSIHFYFLTKRLKLLQLEATC